MKKISLFLIILLSISLSFCFTDFTGARGRGSHTGYRSSRHRSYSTSRSVRVRGYTRKDGTYVAPYTRSAPRSKSSFKVSGSTSIKSPKGSYNATVGVQRDIKGRIKRSSAARKAFMRKTGYPHGRPGYVIDHIIPLKRGGSDTPDNMQWQTIEEAKAKDKVE